MICYSLSKNIKYEVKYEQNIEDYGHRNNLVT